MLPSSGAYRKILPACCHRCRMHSMIANPRPPLRSQSVCSPLLAGGERAGPPAARSAGEGCAEEEQRASTPERRVEAEEAAVEQQESAGVRVALGLLSFYKAAVSPLLQPACRFLPTCSAYAMDAYKKYGVGRGTVLTAWRLARCNPIPGLGGSGYDPVKWPPPGLEWLGPAE